MSVHATAQTALAQARVQFDQAARAVQKAAAPPRPAAPRDDRVDLSAAAVELLAARTAFRAALQIARTADDLNRRSIDLLA